MERVTLLAMDKFTKYVALFIVSTALVLGIVKLTRKEKLHFITPTYVQTTITIPAIAYKHTSSQRGGDQKSEIELFSNNYLIVKVPTTSHPTALLYKNHKLPLIKVKTQKNVTIYKTPPIKVEIPQPSVEVKLLYRKKIGYKIPQEALISYKNRHYIIAKKGDTILPLTVTIKKKQNNFYIVEQNLANLQIALISQQKLRQELKKLLQKEKKE